MEPTRFPDGIVTKFADENLVKPNVIVGFVGAGLAGPIAVGHIISEMKFNEFACMRSRHLPPASVFIRGKLQHPFRFYSHTLTNTCAVICETTIQMDGVYDIISAIFDWLDQINAKELVILDGIASEVHDGVAYYAGEDDAHGITKKPGINLIEKGFLTGISGGMLDECLLHDVHGSALLVKANKDNADPEAASTLVNVINTLYGFDVQTEQLLRNSAQINNTFSELSKHYTRHREQTRGMYM